MDARKALSQLRLKYDIALLEPFYVEVEFIFFDDHRYAGRVLIVPTLSDISIPCQLNCSTGVSIEVFRIIDILLDDENLFDLTKGTLVSSYATLEMLENHISFVLKDKLLCIKRIMNQKYLNYLLEKK